MKWIEVVSNTIESFIDVLDGALEICPLFGSEIGGGNSVWRVVFCVL